MTQFQKKTTNNKGHISHTHVIFLCNLSVTLDADKVFEYLDENELVCNLL